MGRVDSARVGRVDSARAALRKKACAVCFTLNPKPEILHLSKTKQLFGFWGLGLFYPES